MIFSTKKLSDAQKEICLKTVSSKAIFALVGDAIASKESMSIVRMGDGERKILASDTTQVFTGFNQTHEGWNARLGIEGMPVKTLQESLIEAGNTCTYFAPSVSGISFPEYDLYQYFNPRTQYFDNFYVNDWTHEMIRMLFEASDGIFILHREYKKIISSFKKHYTLPEHKRIDGFLKESWADNDDAISAAIASKAQLILYSGGPGAKGIGPHIAQTKGRVALDIGNTLIPWSKKRGIVTKRTKGNS